MASDKLSQDEINALLKQSGDMREREQGISLNINDYISDLEQDTLGEIDNISFGNSSTVLSTLLSQKVDITTPELSIIEIDKLKQEFPQPHVAIDVKYTEGLEGINLLVIKQEDAKIIADLMLGQDDGIAPQGELNDMHISAVQEAMNQMMGSAATSMSTIFNRRIDISPPGIDIFHFSQDSMLDLLKNEILIKVSFRIKIGQLIDSKIMQLIPVDFAKYMVQLLSNKEEDNAQEKSASEMENQPNPSQMKGESTLTSKSRSTHIQPVQYSDFNQNNENEIQKETKNLNLLLDIPLQVTVELGRTKQVIKDILELSPGSIIELDKLAGEPVDILVNNKLIAKGEVVVIEENFGVRVTDILSQWDRLQKLQ